jgi:hypothetical protein
MTERLASAYYRVDVDEASRLVRLERSVTPFPTVAEAVSASEAMLRAVAPHAGWRLLFDLRRGPARNDPEFEKATAPLRERLHKLFPRMALLVRTVAGGMHVRRLARGPAGIFLDEAGALRYLEQAAP